ncbi:MAG: hypothetical protein JSR48_02010 [Verrucomicrobia bacterium]|nr:hypothetical protein [Verrucomicrobiota bacterium]
MRSALLLACLFAPLVARAGEVDFVRVWTNWRTAESFERISEYFTGRENTGSEVVIRSQPSHREGYYFLARVRNHGAAQPAAKLVLSVIKPDAPQVRVYTFPAALGTGDTVFDLGLTGPDWPGSKARPVAWKLEAVATDGTLLAVYKSFLWEKPGQ